MTQSLACGKFCLVVLVLLLGAVRLGHAANPPATREATDAPRVNESLRAELIGIGADDQRYRAALQARFVKDPSATTQPSAELVELIQKQGALDRKNVRRLGQMVDRYGWPGKSLVGAEASTAAFLIVQHAELAVQKKYLPMLRAAAGNGEADPGEVAMLEDRVLMREGKKQIYGTQLHAGPETGGKLVLYPIEDEARVDQRRAAIGLPPLAEYVKQFNLQYSPTTRAVENGSRPGTLPSNAPGK